MQFLHRPEGFGEGFGASALVPLALAPRFEAVQVDEEQEGSRPPGHDRGDLGPRVLECLEIWGRACGDDPVDDLRHHGRPILAVALCDRLDGRGAELVADLALGRELTALGGCDVTLHHPVLPRSEDEVLICREFELRAHLRSVHVSDAIDLA
jgi:hypothetical protein